MNWYEYTKTSSAKDNKMEQIDYLKEKISEAISQAFIGGEETINLIAQLIGKLEGEGGFRNLIPPSITKNVTDLLNQAKDVKRDSPHKCCSFLEEALTYLY